MTVNKTGFAFGIGYIRHYEEWSCHQQSSMGFIPFMKHEGCDGTNAQVSSLKVTKSAFFKSVSQINCLTCSCPSSCADHLQEIRGKVFNARSHPGDLRSQGGHQVESIGDVIKQGRARELSHSK